MTVFPFQINTNGLVAFEEPPPQGEYLGKTPAAFAMIAALLGDLDNSEGRGSVYFRQDSRPRALRRAAEHLKRAFPGGTEAEPVHTLVVTWEKMAGAGGRGAEVSRRRPESRRDSSHLRTSTVQRNTFQLVVASSRGSSHAILLFPRRGLQFLSTAVGGGSALLQTGFNQGLVGGWLWRSQGAYFRCSGEDQASVRSLPRYAPLTSDL